MRQKWFAAWLGKHAVFNVKDILAFHLFAGEGDENTQVRMSIYGIVKTVSITCIERKEGAQTMYYSDLQGEKDYFFGAYRFQSVAEGLSIPQGYGN